MFVLLIWYRYGKIVCFLGEMITNEEARKREARYCSANEGSFIYDQVADIYGKMKWFVQIIFCLKKELKIIS